MSQDDHRFIGCQLCNTIIGERRIKEKRYKRKAYQGEAVQEKGVSRRRSGTGEITGNKTQKRRGAVAESSATCGEETQLEGVLETTK